MEDFVIRVKKPDVPNQKPHKVGGQVITKVVVLVARVERGDSRSILICE